MARRPRSRQASRSLEELIQIVKLLGENRQPSQEQGIEGKDILDDNKESERDNAGNRARG